MLTGQRQRTLGTTWATTKPGQIHKQKQLILLYIWKQALFKKTSKMKHLDNSNGSTHLARTTTRSPLTEWQGGNLTTGRQITTLTFIL